MNRYAGCMLLLCATSVFAAPQPGKVPWLWTDDERLAVRFDPQAMAERNAAYARSQSRPATLGRRSVASGLQYVIDGRRNPELLMRHELLDSLLRGLGPDKIESEEYRRTLDQHLRILGMDPSSFWAGLSEAGHSYLKLKRELEARGHGRTGAEENALCRARSSMLTAAEKRFGEERFDKLLYTAVAPFVVHTESTTYPDPVGRLRREAGGCR